MLQTAMTLVAEIRKNAIPFSFAATQTWPTSFPDDDVIEIHDADNSLTGPSGGRVVESDARWEPMPPRGLTTIKSDRKNVLSAYKMTKAWGLLQEIAKSVSSVRKKEQPEMAAIRATITELGGILRALGTAHIAVAKHLDASRPEPLEERTSAAETTSCSEEDQELLRLLEETRPRGKAPTSRELPAITPALLSTMHSALYNIRSGDWDVADMWEVIRHFASQAESYRGVRAE